MIEPVLVSVVTPSLNQAGTIADTLESVRRQIHPHIEHIVVDGGSTDGTLEILAAAGESVRWASEPDTGMYDALNKGFAQASGEILAYLNTDDAWFPWTVARAVEALGRHRDAGFVFGDLLIEGPSGQLRLDFHPPFRLAYLRRHGFLAQPTVFLRRSVWEEAGPFDASLQLLGDIEYWSRIAERFPGRKVNEVLALQRNHPDAKRFAQPDVLAAELAAVRARYPRPGRLRGRLAWAEATLWRRLFTLAFLAGRGGWAHFLRESGVRISRVRLAATMLPFVGRPFAAGAIRPERTFPA
ncbi:MAG: glycosyltransferase family 2 protein [Gaiellaceae bacterium]